MLELRRFKKLALSVEVFKNYGIGVLYEHTRVRSFGGKIALAVYELYERQVVLLADLRVVLTESGGDVNYTCTVGHGNVIIAGNVKAFLMLLFGAHARALVKRLVFFIFEVGALVSFENFVSGLALFGKLAENAVEQSLSHDIGIAVGSLYAAVSFVGVYTESHVGRKSPRGGRPSEEVSVLALYLKSYDSRALFNGLIALRNFVRRKGRSAAGAVRNYLKALIQQTLIVDLL